MSALPDQLRAMAERLMDYNIPVERQLNFDAAALMLKAAKEIERLRNVIFGPLPPTLSSERKEGGK